MPYRCRWAVNAVAGIGKMFERGGQYLGDNVALRSFV